MNTIIKNNNTIHFFVTEMQHVVYLMVVVVFTWWCGLFYM
jgi:hypothetical protein